jgi:hypothetical protein
MNEWATRREAMGASVKEQGKWEYIYIYIYAEKGKLSNKNIF